MTEVDDPSDPKIDQDANLGVVSSASFDGDGRSLSVADVVAMVAGGAVASVHLRGIVNERFIGPGWMMIWFTFVWVAISSSGPFLVMIRLFRKRSKSGWRVGEVLWGLIGLPWLVTAVLQRRREQPGAPASELVATTLSLGLALVSLVSIAVIWEVWVKVTPDKAETAFAGTWIHRVGLLLAIAWPIQCGVGMVVMS